MARLIDATRIEQYILNNCSDNEEINAIYGEIINAPTIEADPIKHGRWIVLHGVLAGDDIYGDMGECSNCGLHLRDWEWNYCPNCGARMDEVENG